MSRHYRVEFGPVRILLLDLRTPPKAFVVPGLPLADLVPVCLGEVVGRGERLSPLGELVVARCVGGNGAGVVRGLPALAREPIEGAVGIVDEHPLECCPGGVKVASEVDGGGRDVAKGGASFSEYRLALGEHPLAIAPPPAMVGTGGVAFVRTFEKVEVAPLLGERLDLAWVPLDKLEEGHFRFVALVPLLNDPALRFGE